MKIWISKKRKIDFLMSIHILMAILFILLSGLIISLNKEGKFSILIGCIAYLLLTTIRHYNISHWENKIIKRAFPYIEGAIIIIISTFDITNSILSIYVLIMMDITIDYDFRFSIIFSTFGYFAYMYKYIQPFTLYPLGTQVLLFLIGVFQIILYFGFAYLAKKYYSQNNKLKKTTADLNSKMIALEQITLLKERNRIAGEIHNTVGHQLTTALVQIEATQLLIDNNPLEVKRRLDIIKMQVREGLQEIRKSINAINAEHEFEDLHKPIENLIHQVKTHANVNVDFQMTNISDAKLELKKSLYHFILETITNAIRHGNCQNIKIEITYEKGIITLTSFNDGIVPTDYKYGYGLIHMKETIKTLGGTFSTKINNDGWFGIMAQLPLYSRKGME
jgi:signal transduction histidine kinase